MKLIRMLLGTTGFLMLLLGAHFHIIDQVVCEKDSVELTLEFARILKLDQAYDNIKERLSPTEEIPEIEEGSLESEADDALDAAVEETRSYAGDWNNRYSNTAEEIELAAEAVTEGIETEEKDEETLKASKWGGLVQREDVYEWTPPGLLSGVLIAFGLVITVMNIVTTSKTSSE